MQYNQWLRRYTHLRQIADRVAQSRNRRARQACQEAGLDPSLLGIHPHNAMCSFREGRPWPEVDYSKVRLCLWLLDREFEGYRILEGWDARVRQPLTFDR